MNVVEIKQMLDTVWPTGISPDSYPVLAGMIALSKGTERQDLAQPPLRDHFVKGLVRGLTTSTQPTPKAWTPLTWERVREIKIDLAQGKLSQAEIARKFGVNPKAISQIKQGTIWANDPKKEPEPARIVAPSPRTPMARIHDHLHKGQSTQKGIAKALGLGPWAVKRALWRLVREGRVERRETVQGPHLYGIKK